MRERASAAFAIKKIGRGVPPLPTEFGWERAFPSMYKSKEWDRGAPLFPSKALRGSQRPLPQGERAKRLAPREWPNGLAFVPANADTALNPEQSILKSLNLLQCCRITL